MWAPDRIDSLDDIDVLLKCGGDDHLWRLAEAGIDDLEALIAWPRASTLAPRSWPSRPGLAMRTLIGRTGMPRL
jgi:hypothetical protein